jgi:exopolysaccharide production protein ExoY
MEGAVGSQPIATSARKQNNGTTVASRCGTSVYKRAFDILVSGSLLVFGAPLLILIALGIKLQDGGPVLYSHKRIGRNNREFGCLKFRSMVTDANVRLAEYLQNNPEAREEWARTQKLSNDPRITTLGKFLRKSSLDEIPQLWNILRGDMSLVGPRPIVHDEVPRYGDHIRYYLSARPGLTGLWQVSGRSDTSYDYRVNLDVNYVENWHLGKDIMIMVKTIPAVLEARGAR